MLAQILEDARVDLEKRRVDRSLGELYASIEDAPGVRSLAASIRGAPGMAVIAEVKRRSPSAGELASDVDAVQQALTYAVAGAAAVSVLTNGPHFGGELADLRAIRAAGISVPVLRKDFLLDEYCVVEARAAGADAVLLIVSALDAAQLARLVALAADLGMDALVEVHDASELEVALAAGAQVIGINNRNLSTFETSLSTTLELAPRIPAECITVSESAISTAADVRSVRDAGADAVLVGTALMRSANPALKLRELVSA